MLYVTLDQQLFQALGLVWWNKFQPSGGYH